MDEKGLRDSAGVNAGVSLSGLCNLEEVADCHIEVKCSLVLPGVAEITPKDTEGLDELARMELVIRESQFVSVLLNFCPSLATDLFM